MKHIVAALEPSAGATEVLRAAVDLASSAGRPDRSCSRNALRSRRAPNRQVDEAGGESPLAASNPVGAAPSHREPAKSGAVTFDSTSNPA